MRFYECVCFHMLGNYQLSEVKSKNLVNTIIEQELNDEYYKLLCAFLRRLNSWSVQHETHAREIDTLRKKFEKLRTKEDDVYVMNSGFLNPDLVLDHIKSKHYRKP
jgi:hypothetical protein